ncbi:MAG: MMPL family transporter, partial [Haloferacaceae archaeon]
MERPATHERAVEAVNREIVDHPGRVILAFLVMTAAFAGGLPAVSVASGTDQFFESVPEHDTQEYVDDRFGTPFSAGEATTQVVVIDDNVASKRTLVRTLELQAQLQSDPSLRVEDVTSLASGVARVLDPEATTPTEQRRAIETATQAEVREATRTLFDRRPAVTQLLSEDRNLKEPRASSTILVVSHATPGEEDATLESVQERLKGEAELSEGEVLVYGSALQDARFNAAIFESLTLIVPTVTLLILAFLVVAYRDPIDLALALVSLIFALVWTFGFMGYAGIAFNQIMIAVPVLILGVGIDFGIHSVNRYREERLEDADDAASMRAANEQLLVAFFVVSVTNVIGFSANVTSALGPIREFGVVVAVGMVFTFFVFGIFLPALKLVADGWRRRAGVPQFSVTPLGGDGSSLGRALQSSAAVARERPVALFLAILLITGAAGYSATDVESRFESEDFLPYAEHPPQLAVLPDAIAPAEYEITGTTNYISDSYTTT